MAGVKISALPAVTTPAATDILPVDQGGTTKGETVTQLLTAKPYGVTSNVSIGPTMVNLQSLGADMTGGSLSDAAVTAGLAQLPNGGGILYSPAGTLKISATIPGANAMKIKGDGRSASIIKWGGAVSTPMVSTAPGAGSHVLGFELEGIGLDAASTTGVTPLLLQSWQHGSLTDVLLQNVSGTTTPALRMEVNAGTTSANNTVGNEIRGLYINGAPVGIQLLGQGSGSTNTFVTNNRFHDVYMDAITIQGIRAVQWCDSNAFFGTELALTANSAVGIVLNDSATPAADVGVYNCNFYHLSIDTFGLTSCTGILMNVTKQFLSYGAYFSPVAFGGTPITDNSGRALSYSIFILQDANSTNNIVWKTKGVVIDSGGGAGFGAYTNYINQTATTTGNSPVLATIGTDANVDFQIKGQASGKILLSTNFAHWLLAYGGASQANLDTESAVPLVLGTANANGVTVTPNLTAGAHVIASAAGTPSTSALGANVTSVTFTGNDVRGTIAIVMSGALAANTRIATCTFATTYGATAPTVLMVNETAGVGLTIVNFYRSALSTGVSFDIAADQPLATGTYTIAYHVIG